MWWRLALAWGSANGDAAPCARWKVLTNRLSHSLQAFDQNGDLVDLDVIQKLDAIFNDFRVFVKITDKLRNAQELLRKDAEEFDWENL